MGGSSVGFILRVKRVRGSVVSVITVETANTNQSQSGADVDIPHRKDFVNNQPNKGAGCASTRLIEITRDVHTEYNRIFMHKPPLAHTERELVLKLRVGRLILNNQRFRRPLPSFAFLHRNYSSP